MVEHSSRVLAYKLLAKTSILLTAKLDFRTAAVAAVAAVATSNTNSFYVNLAQNA